MPLWCGNPIFALPELIIIAHLTARKLDTVVLLFCTVKEKHPSHLKEGVILKERNTLTMESVQINIEPCTDNTLSHHGGHRNRRISVDHGRHQNFTDMNGNYGHRMLHRRKSSCETSGLLNSLPVRQNNMADLESLSDIPDWQKTLLKQIENLVVNSKHGDSVKAEIDNELGIITEGVITANQQGEVTRPRRKSLMHPANSLYPPRKISHSSVNHGSLAGHSSHSLAPPAQTSNTNANMGRRKSYANIEHHIARTRRSGSVGNIKDTLPVRGRRSSVCHHGLSSQIPLIRHRRKSTAKQPTFTVSKITSVQRKLHNIYRRRRRKELRHVEQIIPPTITIDNSDGDITDNKIDQDEQVNDINENSEETSQAVKDLAESVDGLIGNVHSNNQNTDVDNSNDNLTVEEPIPVTRRKCSIQMRYFEISRKLRQRRRDRKKGVISAEIDDDNANSTEIDGDNANSIEIDDDNANSTEIDKDNADSKV